MAPRRRTPLLAVLAGLLALALCAVAPAVAGAQTDPGASFGGTGAAPSTTVVGASAAATVAGATTTTTTTSSAGQTLVETAKPPERRLATESRRVMAIIGALVFVALALLVLTIRYWKVTKPVRAVPTGGGGSPALEVPETPAPVVADPDEAPTRRSTRRSRRSVAGADHAAADADWEPRGTGEHAVVEPAPTGTARPGRKARKVALTRSADA